MNKINSFKYLIFTFLSFFVASIVFPFNSFLSLGLILSASYFILFLISSSKTVHSAFYVVALALCALEMQKLKGLDMHIQLILASLMLMFTFFLYSKEKSLILAKARIKKQ